MDNFHLEGIVIKRINIGEADRLLTLFSKKQGKIKILGKGIRKIASRRAPHLEIFSQVNVFLHQGKIYPYVTEAQLIYGFSDLRKNFRKIVITYHLCEIIDKLLPEKEKNEELYHSFIDTLLFLEKENSAIRIRQGVRFFVNNLLTKLGYITHGKDTAYSQLIYEIENIIEKPLSTLRLLTKISREIE